MKLNIIKSRLLAALLCLIGAAQAQAYDFTSNGIYYSIIGATNFTCEVTNRGWGSYSGDVEVPATVTYNGHEYTVIQIGKSAFRDCNTLFSVKCPDTVMSIDDYAFYGCN